MLSASAFGSADNLPAWTLIVPNITKASFNNCFIILCFEIKNDKCTVAQNLFDTTLEKSCIARACRLCLFPKLTVGS